MTTRLLIIRHGETDANVQQRYAGNMDVEINERGRRQAERLGQRLKEEPVHKIFVSDRKRAIQSAEIVFPGRELEVVPDLCEMCFGIFEGMTYEEIMGKYPQEYQKWMDDPYDHTLPSGESINSFSRRVIKAVKKIVAQSKNETVAVVAHGGIISVFINHILNTKDFWGKLPRSTSLSIVEYINDELAIRLFDDTGHLADPDLAAPPPVFDKTPNDINRGAVLCKK